ncbi:hypothetical protein V6N13_136406 [Hibiscus sabdariffa]|uniref:Polygalacturonase n=1 Tax=Hibiscus sabdariffa TaxID=183260 RepID=A0ABR2DPX7_9ROSI
MPFHQVPLLLFFIFSCLFFVTIQTRHRHSHSEHDKFHAVSHVSVPPSPSPSPSTSPAPVPEAVAGSRYSVFSVLDFGAIGDGVTDDTQAFKLAWDTACQTESAVLLVPDGYSFMLQSTVLAGPCKTAGLVFQIEGTIMPPDGPDSWPRNISKRQWLVFYRINGMLMQGGGLVDGKGEKWWNLPCKPHKGIYGTTMPGPCDSPVAIRFFMSSNLTVKGLKIKNSPQFHFSIGSLGINHSRACVSNITVSDSVIQHSDNGIRIKTWQGGSGCVSKVKFRNISMEAVRNPIIIDQYYCLTKNCSNQTSAVVINDISYVNIKGSYDVRSPPMSFACSDSTPCINLTLAQVELQPATRGRTVANPYCWNAHGTVLTQTIPPVYCLMEETNATNDNTNLCG